jgi:hypothetical protein
MTAVSSTFILPVSTNEPDIYDKIVLKELKKFSKKCKSLSDEQLKDRVEKCNIKIKEYDEEFEQFLSDPATDSILLYIEVPFWNNACDYLEQLLELKKTNPTITKLKIVFESEKHPITYVPHMSIHAE